MNLSVFFIDSIFTPLNQIKHGSFLQHKEKSIYFSFTVQTIASAESDIAKLAKFNRLQFYEYSRIASRRIA